MAASPLLPATDLRGAFSPEVMDRYNACREGDVREGDAVDLDALHVLRLPAEPPTVARVACDNATAFPWSLALH